MIQMILNVIRSIKSRGCEVRNRWFENYIYYKICDSIASINLRMLAII
jgi:hypothetical protein